MAQFRVLSVPDVVEILGLFSYDPATYLGHQPIAVGTINTNVRVETTQGPRFLRINEGKTLDDVKHEAAIVEFLAARGVPTPAPLPRAPADSDARLGGEGATSFAHWRGEIVSLFPWLPGRTLSRAEVTAGHARQAGRALARLHLAGASFPDHRPGRYEPDEIDRRLTRVADAARADASLADAVALLVPELAALAVERTPELPSGVIHGDLFIDNVLFDGPALVALLDFEQASWGRLAYDLAVTTLAFGFGRDDFRPDIVSALFEGYRGERLLNDAERHGFACELRFAACRFAITRITDVYLKRVAGAAPGKDYRRYLSRWTRVGEHLAANDGLLMPFS
jgi:homoserine kinase type II